MQFDWFMRMEIWFRGMRQTPHIANQINRMKEAKTNRK